MRNMSLLALDKAIPADSLQLVKRLLDLAQDLRWTWSHAGDSFWRRVDRDIWEKTRNPYVVLQERSLSGIESLTKDPVFLSELEKVEQLRAEYMASPGWETDMLAEAGLRGIAYFTMEIGLGPALPLYAGGLGILAGDFMKGASDLGLPVIGFSLLYKRGYFRQTIDIDGSQQEVYSYNDTLSLPVRPALNAEGGWLQIPVALPGRDVLLRVWKVSVGRNTLYLLDSDSQINLPSDRGITGTLYGGNDEVRLAQEMVLGIGGWRIIETLGLDVQICHMNEGHTAFAGLERARHAMQEYGCDFQTALWAVRAGNVFTTHTPVEYAFDQFDRGLFNQYLGRYCEQLNTDLEAFWQLGQQANGGRNQKFDMVNLAMNISSSVNAVSKMHGEVSRRKFNPLFPRWPYSDTPVSSITNGVHMPSWDSVAADILWTKACGKERWRLGFDGCTDAIDKLSDAELWDCRNKNRAALVNYCRAQFTQRQSRLQKDVRLLTGHLNILDPNTLTLGFARRFTDYKRTNLLLTDPERLARLLSNPERPIQLVIAGKAHPIDDSGKNMLRRWARFVERPDVCANAILIEDYDMSVAQHLVQGVDVWINTPRVGWEACGTSGMKVLVNGGLNLSAVDGWWAEAGDEAGGWSFGNHEQRGGNAEGQDTADAELLYELLEQQVIPEFYARDHDGLPRGWIARMRISMSELTPRFSTNRMLSDYTRDLYVPSCQRYHRRTSANVELAQNLQQYAQILSENWHDLHWGDLEIEEIGDCLRFSVALYLGEVPLDCIAVQLYSNTTEHPMDTEYADIPLMKHDGSLSGAINAHWFSAVIQTDRPCSDFTPRAIVALPTVTPPLEMPFISWYPGH